MILSVQGVCYVHPNRALLFSDLYFSIKRGDKVALVGHNGSGKSTFLKLIAGALRPSAGTVTMEPGTLPAYYIPQATGAPGTESVAEALGIEPQLRALRAVLAGNPSAENLDRLDEDWDLEERLEEAFRHWGLGGLDPLRPMDSLSGGERTKVYLAGMLIRRPDLVLLDEPTNHLDADGRRLLYDYVRTTDRTLLIASHDKTLLNLLETVVNLHNDGLTVYGGNYAFFTAQKRIEAEAFSRELKTKEKMLRKARETERESLARQQKTDARGHKKQRKAGMPVIVMHALKNGAENSTARIKDIHAQKVNALSRELERLRDAIPDPDKIKMSLEDSGLHKGKWLVRAHGIRASYGDRMLWREGLYFQLTSGDRVALKGPNGSGKTTLVKLVLGTLAPASGRLERVAFSSLYLDQDYSILNPELSIYEQAQLCNTGGLEEHEVKTRLHRFLFTSSDWQKTTGMLSGGEKMRLILCCMTIRPGLPDLVILDEPTNNLDMQNVEILCKAIVAYKGTLLVISHDELFLNEIGIDRFIPVG